MLTIWQYFRDFLDLFFPVLCAGCGKNLVRSEQEICTTCIYLLPHTNFHLDPENQLAKQLWGRFPFVQASAFAHFHKGSKVQNIMHQLKYRNRPETGQRMGELYGKELMDSDWKIPDLIIPVPLHPRRLKKRGYNQAEEIAKGISQVIGVPISSTSLLRTNNTPTQTRKNRFSRYENLIDAFQVFEPEILIGKHVLLVDDVMTTGATIESCAVELLKIEGVKISVCTLAYAE